MSILALNKTLTSLSFLCLLSISQASYSGIVNNGYWQVQPGDSLYSIARQMHPGNKKQQQVFRQQLLKLNQQSFAQGADYLSSGITLTLPQSSATRTAEKKPLVKPTKKPVTKAPIAIAKTAVVKPVPVMADSQPAEDSIGKIVINVGRLEAVNNGKTRLLKRHSEIRQGDTLKTAANTHAQIRFKDGALISLRPKTEFHIAQYNFDGEEDGTERGIFELIKGGFRTITGAIGHKNKQNYQVKTAVATIGIRGTHYGLMLCAAGSCQNNNNLADGLYGGVVDGSVVIDNQTGQHSFNNDQYFHLANASAQPVELLNPTQAFSADPDLRPEQPDGDVVENDRPPEGDRGERGRIPVAPVFDPKNNCCFPPRPNDTSLVLEQPLPREAPNGAGMALSFNHYDPNGNGITGTAAPVIISAFNNNHIFLNDITDPSGNVISNIPFGGYEESPNGNRHSLALRRPDGTGAVIIPSSLGGSPIGVNWGRWQGNYVVLENGVQIPHTGNMHFIYSDKVTDPATLANLGGLGASVSYSTATVGGGGTASTDHLGNIGTVANITMSVDFLAQKVSNYSVGTTVAGQLYQAGASNIAFSQLNDGFHIQSISAGCNAASCQGDASVIFVGPQAQGAMSSYSINASDGSGGVSGAGLLVR